MGLKEFDKDAVIPFESLPKITDPFTELSPLCMATIIPIKGSATSGLLDVWQAHIQQQQVDKAQAAVSTSNPGGQSDSANAGSATGASATGSAAAGGRDTRDGRGDGADSGGENNNNTDSRRIDANMVEMVRGARDGARQMGKAVSDVGDASGADPVVAQTIKKLKAMLAKVMAQLDAVRNNDRMPPDEKLQMTASLSSQAMSIQAQILALMNPLQTRGSKVNTTA